MKLELKNVKIHPDMSQETDCFSADLWVDGKKTGQVRNEGHGGSHRYDIPYAIQDKLHEWAKALPRKYDDIEMDLDQAIDTLLTESEHRRWLARNTKGKTLVRFKGDKKGSWAVFKTPYSAQVDAGIVKAHGDRIECIANRDLEAAIKYCG